MSIGVQEGGNGGDPETPRISRARISRDAAPVAEARMTKPPNLRLATRVAISASAMTLFFVIALGWGAWMVTAQLIQGQINELLRIEATLRAEKIADLLKGVETNFRTLASNPVVADALVDGGAKVSYLQPLLAGVPEVNGLPVSLMVTDLVGRPLLDADDRQLDGAGPWVAAVASGTRARAKLSDGPGGAVLCVAQPVVRAAKGGRPQETQGALVWSIALADLAKGSIPASVMGALRIEHDGKVLSAPLGGGMPSTGGQVLMAEVVVPLAPPLNVFRMTLAIGAEQKVMTQSLDRLGRVFMAIGMLATCLVVLAAIFLGRRLTRALTRLSDAAQDFTFGADDAKDFLIDGDDEIARLGAAFADMALRVEQAYRDLEQRSNARLSDAERVARVGSATWEVRTGHYHWSDQFHALLGVEPGDELPGRAAFLRRVHPDDRERVVLALDGLIQGEDGRLVDDIRIIRRDGEARVCQLRAEVGRDSMEIPVRVDITIQDITERKRMEDKLDALVRELRRSNEELEQFAYAASHDLRQPLRTIRSYITLVEEAVDDKLDDETREFMDFIRDGVKRMDALITDLLAYSRVGRTSESVPVDTGRSLDMALMDLHVEVDDAQALIDMPSKMPVVPGDAVELTRLFQNLVGNALKYRRTDRPCRITIGYLDLGDDWEFKVEDNGIGIQPEHAERVFGIFQRLHARDEYEGTGIGLAICRKVVEHSGGRIWAEPAGDGGGTCFRFTWPKMSRKNEAA